MQTMWEDNNTKAKWVLVNQYYFLGDLLEVVGHPRGLESESRLELFQSSKVPVPVFEFLAWLVGYLASQFAGAMEVQSLEARVPLATISDSQ
ncbi:PHD finger family [Olea europaea subsp. europaea]|uniref:PHD finger family n=1 Tax=Olea europaea subsp. europaea TaxID=158383 RepID=A0A8S0T5Q7_OLEEU|nr:PHD finger family [Olea europaea subsp. europaea]